MLCIGATNAALNSMNDVISIFPSFLFKTPANDSLNLGFVHFAGFMAGSQEQYGIFGKSLDSLIGGLQATGPLVIFNEDLSDSIVISTLSNFIVGNLNVSIGNCYYYISFRFFFVSYLLCNTYTKTKQTNKKIVDKTEPSANELQYGIIGNVSELPARYRVEFVMSLGEGIRPSFEKWGDKMLNYYGKTRDGGHERDLTLQYLGYSTDNGISFLLFFFCFVLFCFFVCPVYAVYEVCQTRVHVS